MSEFVELCLRRNRGWPWPADSWGLTPMFGAHGWCRSCGGPRAAQSGPLTLQRRGMNRCRGAWVPYWRYDVLCLAADLAEEVARRFTVEFREVAWRGTAPGPARQLVVPTVGTAWFDPESLGEAATGLHERAGAACPECGVWRWLPVPVEHLPPPLPLPELADHDVAASPEFFGDGYKAFRRIRLRRELAEFLVTASPADFEPVDRRAVPGG